MQAEAKKAMLLGAEDMAIVEKMCEGFTNMDTSPDLSGSLNVDTFMKIFEVIVRLSVKLINKSETESKAQRRVYLENKDQQNFAQSCMMMLQESMKKKQ